MPGAVDVPSKLFSESSGRYCNEYYQSNFPQSLPGFAKDIFQTQIAPTIVN